MTPDFSSAVYRRSRRAYVLQCMFEYLIALLVADAFLAKLLSALEIDDATVGIISSFITLAFTVQILSVLLCRRRMNSKKISTVLNCVGHLLFIFLYLTPFLPFRGTGVKLIVMGIILASYAMRYLVATIVFRWANSFVDPNCRADFSAKKEIISLLCGMAFTASVGYIFGRFESAGKMETGFLVIAILVLVLNVANFICFLCIGKEEIPEDREVCGTRCFTRSVWQASARTLSTFRTVTFARTALLRRWRSRTASAAYAVSVRPCSAVAFLPTYRATATVFSASRFAVSRSWRFAR